MKTKLFKATEKGLLGVCVLSHGIIKAVEKIEETSFNKAVSVRAKRTGNTEKQCADELCDEYNAVLESIDNKVERLRSMIRRDKESCVISSEVQTVWEPKLC